MLDEKYHTCGNNELFPKREFDNASQLAPLKTIKYYF
jgi:hypothetical protein